MHADTLRSADRPSYPYTMKTARSAPPAHGTSRPYRSSTKSSTPLGSPSILAYSVGQAYPPKLSPKRSPGLTTTTTTTTTTVIVSPGRGAEPKRPSSPSYFGLLVEPSAELRESAAVPHDNWSSPSSSVRSFATALPKQRLPVDANPAYEAFRRQVDASHDARSFALSATPLGSGKTPPARPYGSCFHASTAALTPPRSQPRSAEENGSAPEPSVPTADADADASGSGAAAAVSGPGWSHAGRSFASQPAGSRMDVETEVSTAAAPDAPDASRGSNGTSSPHVFRSKAPAQPPQPALTASERKVGQSSFRFPLTLGVSGAIKGPLRAAARANAAPTTSSDAGHELIDVTELKTIMELTAPDPSKLLLLDVRVSTYYGVSRIMGALNLCIPTTLLRRATFNLQKMQLTFANTNDQAQFAKWRDARYLVVYDSESVEKRDATAPLNMLRKFTNEGFTGRACMLRGGFKAFEAAYPGLVDRQATGQHAAGSASLSLDPGGKRGGGFASIAPVIGGVMLPGAGANTDPFFANIRQNIDLADGVGRLELAMPAGVNLASLPRWLREASEPCDHGQRVSDKFLGIERAEQARMRIAYAAINPSAHRASVADNVQLSGIEKGGKNRYKDILPFEHARVRLQGRPAGVCDYVNASHIRASRSLKRYIASQGPLPATFDDFWSMIWDEDVRVIVMLTAESEGGQLKCHPYWTGNEYGAIRLRLLSEKKVSLDVDKHRSNSILAGSVSLSDPSSYVSSGLGRRRANTLVSADRNGHSEGLTPAPTAAQYFGAPSSLQGGEKSFVVVRRFALSHSSHPFSAIREVTQLHYASWPDFGAPAQPSHLLALVELANVLQHAASPSDTPSPTPSFFAAASNGVAAVDGKRSPLLRPFRDEPESNAKARPILVHCSAGCGRTGTFCTVDAVIDMLKRQHRHQSTGAANTVGKPHHINGQRPSNTSPDGAVDEDVTMTDAKPDDGAVDLMRGGQSDSNLEGQFSSAGWLDDDNVDLVASTVEDFRTQRLSMVQSLRQFVLCYETVAEWVSKKQNRSAGAVNGTGRARSESMRTQSTI
ncbi:protein tyrosine phosphatase [Niveomyces insectorum RCEF 264]|uniref:protein-tyrosine-phosphatase n=1 Tax=Niveomyces insectorum RCEF 264 TaxID=1081102 RepID=A0A167Q9E5_9HYPO|nr:protein tyrosine phosphatase [Niveomyces insectorum RCEF 264]